MKQKELYWWWSKFLSKESIKKINECKPLNYGAKFDRAASTTKTSKVVFLPYLKNKKYLNNAIPTCYYSNKQNFYLDLFDFDENKPINHNTYSSKNKDQYKWHIDSNNTFSCDIKFTVLINVSEKKYEGGEFKIMNGSIPQEVKEFSNPGDMIMFRSPLLHKVTPVIKGIRKTLTFFLLGPNFK